MARWRVPTSRRPAREGHSSKGTQHQTSPVSPKTRAEGRAVSVPGRPHNGTVRYRPQHPCTYACMPIVLSCSTYAILVLHYSVIRSITARAHHPHQALDPNVPRTYSCRQPGLLISQLVFAKQTGAGRHAGMQAKPQKQSKASPLSSGTQVLGRWSVVDSFVDRSGHLATRSLASASTCVLRLCFHHTPYTPEL